MIEWRETGRIVVGTRECEGRIEPWKFKEIKRTLPDGRELTSYEIVGPLTREEQRAFITDPNYQRGGRFG